MREGFAGLAAWRLNNRRSLLIWLAIAVFLIVAIIHLGTQPSGLSPAESTAVSRSHSFDSITKNPVNAPHDILSYGLGKISGGLLAMRLSSVIWGLIFAVCFYSASKSLFGRTIGLIGTAIFATTSIFLIASRQASSEIMLISPIMIMAAYAWLGRAQTDKGKAFLLLIILSALSLYVPGMIWWLAGAAIISWPKLEESVLSLARPRIYLCLAVGFAILAPLLLAIAGNWQIIKPLALIPTHFSPPLAELKSFAWMLLAWFGKTPFHSPLIIGRLPILNIVQAILLIVGVYALLGAAKNKAWTLMVAAVFATIAAGLNENLTLLLLGLPAAGLLAATGLRYLYVEWRGVFPRNPAAKLIAISLIVVLGAVQLIYGIRYSVVAWPHTMDTRHTYVLK